MLGHRDLTVEDYAGIFKRRFWLILACAVVFLCIGMAVSYVIPPRYESQTLILIEQQKVPEDYVKPVVDEDLGARLASMREQILSRSRIQPIVERFNLFSGGSNNMDDRVEMTQKGIGIKPIPSGESSHGMPGFYITFTAQDPRVAQQVCGEITSLFVSENLNAREQSAEGTTEFLKQQLADSKRSLDDQDAKLAAFEEKYFGKLPDQENSNSSTLQAYTTQLDAATQSLGRMEQNETFLRALISQQAQDLQQSDSGSGGAGVSVDDRRAQLKSLVEQKQELEALYTPDYPDVVALSRKISDLKAEIAHAEAQPAPAKAATSAVLTHRDSPQLQQLKLQLQSVEEGIASEKLAEAQIQRQIRTYEARIEASPEIEEQYKEITRDHQTALEFYNNLLTKMNESSMATALERRQEGEQFRVMDAPNLPDAPSYPNRRIFAGGGLAGGLFLGLMLTALLEYRDTALRNERDVWAFTKLPTLAIISHIDGLIRPAEAPSRWNPFSRTNKPVESTGS